jgi:cephalosporin hydroxylase
MEKIIDGRINTYQILSEFEELVDIYKELKPNVALEIGSLLGYSLHHWFYHSQPNAKIISVDYPVREFCGAGDFRCQMQDDAIKNEWPEWTKKNNNDFHLIRAKSQDPETIHKVKEILNGDKIDFLFIDGNHEYEFVKQDYYLYRDFVRSGGIIAFHDIAEFESGGGVFKFWNEIKGNHPNIKEILHDPNTKTKGIGVIFA